MPVTGPAFGCDTCRRFIDPSEIQRFPDNKGKWHYKFTCHGERYDVVRSSPPMAEKIGVLRVGLWSPTFKCPTCKKSGVRATNLKRDYPITGRTTFKVEHCARTYYEMFITAALESESILRASGQGSPTMDGVELTGEQKIDPFDAPAKTPMQDPNNPDPFAGSWPTPFQVEKSAGRSEGANIPPEHRLGPYDLRNQINDGPDGPLLTVHFYGKKFGWSQAHARYIQECTTPPPAKLPAAPGQVIKYKSKDGNEITIHTETGVYFIDGVAAPEVAESSLSERHYNESGEPTRCVANARRLFVWSDFHQKYTLVKDATARMSGALTSPPPGVHEQSQPGVKSFLDTVKDALGLNPAATPSPPAGTPMPATPGNMKPWTLPLPSEAVPIQRPAPRKIRFAKEDAE